jgi:hypothetical protein
VKQSQTTKKFVDLRRESHDIRRDKAVARCAVRICYDGLDPASSASGLAGMPRNAGAGEGIRTLDPDLGKVVLYP